MNESMAGAPVVSWVPDAATAGASQLAAFIRHCERATGRAFADWQDFHRWSVAEFRVFWALFVEWAPVRLDGESTGVCAGDAVETARFFPGATVSFTEHVLDGRGAREDDTAIVECHEERSRREVTRGELRRRVCATARALERLGVRAGDRVVAITAHDADTVVIALAALGLGATWSACGPELRADAVLARFTQLEPVLLVSTAAYRQDGASHDLRDHAQGVARGLSSLRAALTTEEVLALAAKESDAPYAWPRLPFDHPLYVLFSSGTTGPPKAIVHGAGGTLLEHLKEHLLHGDLSAADRLYFQTSCGWMMWHWTVSALATGASIVTYDGSASFPDASAIWRLVGESHATVLGASPAFFQFTREAGVVPRALGLADLRAILSTGSVLDDAWFDWVGAQVGSLPLQSISGGTDIIGCFVLGNPMLPVYRGESQCVSLAMDVRAWPDPSGGPDELLCGTPFPSRPVGLLGDTDRSRFHDSYFAAHPGFWTHGDFIALSERGTARILGRSDAVLNVKGVRIGPGEITSIVRRQPEVRDAMAVEQAHADSPGGSRIVLLVQLADGATLDRPLMHRLKRAVRDAASADHVPSVILAVRGFPETMNGKRSERAARDAVEGRAARNRMAIRNPETLDEIAQLAGTLD